MEPVAGSIAGSLSRAEAARRSKLFAIKTATIGSVGGLLFGFDLGVVAGALPQLRDDFDLDAEERGLVVAILLVGSVVGAVVGGWATGVLSCHNHCIHLLSCRNLHQTASAGRR
jgi:MFS family permease